MISSKQAKDMRMTHSRMELVAGLCFAGGDAGKLPP
jgi:hypothetical protein